MTITPYATSSTGSTPAAPPATGPSGKGGFAPDVLRDLGLPRHLLVKTARNGDFLFPPDPIFLHAGDTLSVVAKLNVGRRHGHGHGRKLGLTAATTTYGTGSVTATHDGPAQVTIHATPAGRAALRRNGRVFVSVHLAFRSSAKLGGTSSSKDFRVKLKKRGR